MLAVNHLTLLDVPAFKASVSLPVMKGEMYIKKKKNHIRLFHLVIRHLPLLLRLYSIKGGKCLMANQCQRKSRSLQLTMF